MNKREEIENNPWKILITARRHYSKGKLYIEIEIRGEQKNLFLLSEGLCLGKGKRFHNYDTKGRDFFNDLKPKFGKVWILIPGETEVITFNNYKEFLDKIVRY